MLAGPSAGGVGLFTSAVHRMGMLIYARVEMTDKSAEPTGSLLRLIDYSLFRTKYSRAQVVHHKHRSATPACSEAVY